MPGFTFLRALRDRVIDDFGIPEDFRIELLLAPLIGADGNDVGAGFIQAAGAAIEQENLYVGR